MGRENEKKRLPLLWEAVRGFISARVDLQNELDRSVVSIRVSRAGIAPPSAAIPFPE
jgi:hypothetical protein